MTEGLFVLTTLFVAYVIYVIVNEKKVGGNKSAKPSVAASQTVQQASVSEKPKAAAAKPKPAAAKKATAKTATVAKIVAAPKPETPKPAAKPLETKKVEAKKTVAAPPAKPVDTKKIEAKKPIAAPAPKPTPAPAPEATAIKGTGLKDPKTGEIATSYANYRFTKRWIKEALVAEKLVDKVYKNDELNASVEAKIKAGIIKLEGMKKYSA
jgi:outer membrane biosynthesis protein TonB